MSINEILSINVPYPPELTVEEILSRRTDERLGSRAPNSFFIYRLAYIKEFKKRIGESISMTKISPYVSLSWSKEPPEIKEAYKRLSNWVEHRLIEMRQKNQNNPLVFIHHENSSLPQPPVNDDIIGID
ncbi:kinase-like domain-containing protein [Rhizophagus clarus]|uniref:Kinase-like domain-containing protein n=1 Tax=Rhizophagus clarus TaxID=94130 RepID=A0A8H3M5G2_9GLOM|nr:kinase-like domain-containing protein [Rhizophagus clarus]